ncbi:MAG: response regulator transcription factor [Chloroflexi bacterium]|nr:response regulator transcription factor [Chloroflexota bacterium]
MIVDDHDMLREGITSFLRAYPELQLVGEAASGAEAIRQCQELVPDVVLMDLLMPEMGGVDAIRLIHDQQPGIRIIALSSFGEEELVRAALQAGATSYLLKNVSADHLAEAIRVTYSGLPTISPEVTTKLFSETSSSYPEILEPLTSRELEVLDLMARGLTNDEISLQLQLSKNTIKNHVSNVLGKLGVSNRTEAASMAMRLHLSHKN